MSEEEKIMLETNQSITKMETCFRNKIKELQQENNQLKENLKLEKQISNGIAKDYEILLNQKKELRSWLEEIIPYLKVHGIRTTPDKVLEDVLNKLNELEGGKNEN